MRESTFQRQVKLQFPVSFNIWGNAMQQSGWPDLYFATGYGSGWLELKVDKNRCTPAQDARIRRLRKWGVFAAVLRWRNKTEDMRLEWYSEVGVPRTQVLKNFDELHAKLRALFDEGVQRATFSKSN